VHSAVLPGKTPYSTLLGIIEKPRLPMSCINAQKTGLKKLTNIGLYIKLQQLNTEIVHNKRSDNEEEEIPPTARQDNFQRVYLSLHSHTTTSASA
jgi:hypothetical protein